MLVVVGVGQLVRQGQSFHRRWGLRPDEDELSGRGVVIPDHLAREVVPKDGPQVRSVGDDADGFPGALCPGHHVAWEGVIEGLAYPLDQLVVRHRIHRNRVLVAKAPDRLDLALHLTDDPRDRRGPGRRGRRRRRPLAEAGADRLRRFRAP